MTDYEPIPPLRSETGDEVLDTARFEDSLRRRIAGPRFTERFPGITRALGVTLLIAASAAWGSSEMHASDRQNAARAARDTILLRLLTGDTSVGMNPSGGAEGIGDTAGLLTFTVRDDGTAPVDILGATVDDTGVEVRPANTAPIVAAPGQPVLVALQVKVDCTDPELPQRPGTLTLTVRGADDRVRRTLLTPPPISPSADGGGYYALCGASQTSTTPVVGYDRLITSANAANRTFGYRVMVTVRGDFAERLQSAPPSPSGIPGLSITTDLTGSVLLAPGATEPVVITVHATDCAAVGDALGGGPTSPATAQPNLDTLFTGTALDVTPGDERFALTTAAVDSPTSPRFYADVLAQLLAACPNLA